MSVRRRGGLLDHADVIAALCSVLAEAVSLDLRSRRGRRCRSATKGLLTTSPAPLLPQSFHESFPQGGVQPERSEGGHSLVEWAPAAARGRDVYSTGPGLLRAVVKTPIRSDDGLALPGSWPLSRPLRQSGRVASALSSQSLLVVVQ